METDISRGGGADTLDTTEKRKSAEWIKPKRNPTKKEERSMFGKSLENGFIHKSFRLKNSLPGDCKLNQNRLESVSIQAMSDEKECHENNLKLAKTEFGKNMDVEHTVTEKKFDLGVAIGVMDIL